MVTSVVTSVVTRADSHQQQNVGVRHEAEVLQLPGVGLLLDSHLGQVPQLAHQPGNHLLLLAGVAHGDYSGVPQRLEICKFVNM